MISKSKLAIELSNIKTFLQPDLRLEQYPTDSEIAAGVIWKAYLNGDIKGKIIADLGSGTGILSYGCLLLDAKKVYLIEKEKLANHIAKENLSPLKNREFFEGDVSQFNKKVDTVIQNPPFGTKTRHIDKIFLKKAMQISDKIYSLHKTSTKDFIARLAEKNSFKVREIINFNYPIKQAFPFHKKPIERIKVSCFILEKKI